MELHKSNLDSSVEEQTQIQPFRFFDLPVELRYMVYERLMDKKVYFQFPHLQGFNHMMFGAHLDICFRPGMLRVCKQFKDEYRYLALSRMPLATGIIVHDGAFDEYLSSGYDGGRFFVPDVVLAEIRNVHLTFHMLNPMQSHDHLRLAEKIARKLPKLQKMTVIECLPLHTLDKAVPKNPQIYHEYGRKLERTRDILSSITKEMEIRMQVLTLCSIALCINHGMLRWTHCTLWDLPPTPPPPTSTSLTFYLQRPAYQTKTHLIFTAYI